MKPEANNDVARISPDETERLKNIFGDKIPDDTIQKTFSFARLMSYYRCAMMEIETKFKVLNEEFSLRFDRQPISSIKTRLKNPISIRNKLTEHGLPLTLGNLEQNLNDIAGIRVICSFVDDVYMLAEAFRNQDDIQIIKEKDYISDPKPNGYRSLHLIVAVPIFLQEEKRVMKAEVQLRTIAMDSWATLEHQLRYKKEFELRGGMTEELKKCAELSAALDKRMDMLRKQILGGYATEYGQDVPEEADNSFTGEMFTC